MNLSKLRKMVLDGDMSAQALRYLLECKGECEHLDYKEHMHGANDYGNATLARDIIAMRNAGGGYVVIGVEDKTWKPVGLESPLALDTKELRDLVRKATGLDIATDIVNHQLFVGGEHRNFALILVRSTAKRHKLRVPSVCQISFCPNEKWGVRSGDIYFRKGDQTVRVSSDVELASLLEDLIERQDRDALEQESSLPSPFEIEVGLYRLLPREYENFIGRTRLREEAKQAVEKDPRIWIVNLYGPGGVGKSALANWLGYYYYSNKGFDAILQLSAKDSQLTDYGITRLRPTLYSVENLLDSILLLFGFGEIIGRSIEERKDVVTTLLSDYSSLLILDNMETVQDGRVMEFVRSLPPTTKAKVLLTSRLRSSGWELPIRVDELDSQEVQEFVRIKSEEMGVWPLKNFENVVEDIRLASGGLPLAIQWMLGEYMFTGNWSTVTKRVRSSDSPLLEFSFRNAWNVLTNEAQRALAVLSIFDEPPTLHIWATALNWPAESMERAASRLIEATFVSKKVDTRTGQETFHALPITMEFARNQLAQMGNLETDARTNYQKYVQQMELVAAETERFTSLFEKFSIERDTEKRAVILARKAEAEAKALNYDEAERLYQRALEIDPRSIYVLVNYGLLKSEIGQIGKSLELMKAAVQRCDKNTGFFVYYNLSRVYDEYRDRKMVEECLRKALEYNPSHKVARHQLGVVVSRLGRQEESIQIFDELIRDELVRNGRPSDTLIYAYKSKIISLEKAGRINEAHQVLVEAAEIAARYPHLSGKVRELEHLLD